MVLWIFMVLLPFASGNLWTEEWKTIVAVEKYVSQMLNVWHIYLHQRLILMIKYGKCR